MGPQYGVHTLVYKNRMELTDSTLYARKIIKKFRKPFVRHPSELARYQPKTHCSVKRRCYFGKLSASQSRGAQLV